MKNFKFLCVLILALFFSACEQEPIEKSISEESIIKYFPEKFSIPNQFKVSTKAEANPIEYRLIESEEEYNSLCTDTELIYNDITVDGISITLDASNLEIYASSFGATFTDVSDGLGIRIRIYDYATNSIVFDEEYFNSEPFYWGVSSPDRIAIFIDSNGVNQLRAQNFVIGSCEYIPEIVDTDGDGVPDDEDLMPNSNMEETVMIDGCDSMVDNIPLGDGIMLSDKIEELEAGEYRNHGQYVRATAQYLVGLVEEGVISQEEKDMIMECAGSSSLGM